MKDDKFFLFFQDLIFTKHITVSIHSEASIHSWHSQRYFDNQLRTSFGEQIKIKLMKNNYINTSQKIKNEVWPHN